MESYFHEFLRVIDNLAVLMLILNKFLLPSYLFTKSICRVVSHYAEMTSKPVRTTFAAQ